jgi:1-acyl-sn-glycerol-3-phosphate acyltransferase
MNEILGPAWVRNTRAAVRLTIYLFFTLALIPVQALAVSLKWRLRETLPVFYHRTCCRLWGMTIEVRGELSSNRPTLLVSNHVSYLDIPVLSNLGALSFVAKSEVASWPFFGLLAKLQRTVFVDRRRASAARQRDAIGDRLAAGDRLVLFAEGTSNDGNRVLPFKSALFSVAGRADENTNLTLQAMSLAYTTLNGIPIGRNIRPHYAWYGDMDLGGHLWTFAGLGRTHIVITLHPPLDPKAFPSRRALALHMQEQVTAGVAAALTGRPMAGATEAVDNESGTGLTGEGGSLGSEAA